MKLRYVCVAFGLLTAGLSQAQNVRYEFDRSTDFTRYSTYRWEKHPRPVDLDELTLSHLAAALDAELSKKGLTKTESGSADLVIVYQCAVNQEEEIIPFDGGWGVNYSGPPVSAKRTITVGSVVLEIFDGTRKQLVWRGIASKTLDPQAKPDKRQRTIQKAAEKLFKNYPPENHQ
jgi:hypothetical protein